MVTGPGNFNPNVQPLSREQSDEIKDIFSKIINSLDEGLKHITKTGNKEAFKDWYTGGAKLDRLLDSTTKAPDKQQVLQFADRMREAAQTGPKKQHISVTPHESIPGKFILTLEGKGGISHNWEISCYSKLTADEIRKQLLLELNAPPPGALRRATRHLAP